MHLFIATQIVVVGSSTTSSGIIAIAIIVPVVVLSVIILTVMVFLFWYFWLHSRKLTRVNFTIEMMSAQYQVENPLFDRVGTLKPTGPHEKEFLLENITRVRGLGEGAFGCVYQGVAKNIIAEEESTTVAVKQLKVNTFEDDDIIVRDFFKGCNGIPNFTVLNLCGFKKIVKFSAKNEIIIIISIAPDQCMTKFFL